MLSEKEVEEVKGYLEESQRPLFYYDNDADGLCSFIILRKFLDKGKGVAIRSFPGLNKEYARKARELEADCVFILDKPVVDEEFILEIESLGIPIIWIDHHLMPDVDLDSLEKKYENLKIYNWAKEGESEAEKPVTYFCYKLSGKKEDLWLGVAGCISDHYLPDFAKDFFEKHEDYWKQGIKEPFDALYETEIGKIALGLNFGLKDSTSNIVRLQNFLIEAKEPGEFFEESGKNYSFRKKYGDIKKKYDSLLSKARECLEDEILFFEYGGDLSISSEIANELNHDFKDKAIVVAYKKQGVSNISMRGKGVKSILESILGKLDGSGGGHEDAVGARIKTDDLEKFKELVLEEIKKKV